MVLAAAAAFAGASVQSATGFGFALVLSPALFALLDPFEAVSALAVLGLVLNLLVLGDGGGLRLVRRRVLPLLLAGALPGLAAGVVVLSLLPKPALQIAVGAAVLAAALVQLRRPAGRGPARAAEAVVVGVASGALTTTTSVSGPPIVLWLERQGLRPAELRATLAAGNVVTVEPGVYLPGRFGVRIEDLVVVGEDGPRILTPFTKELVTLD